jgi:transcriptional regulator with XRE-family HTH domain
MEEIDRFRIGLKAILDERGRGSATNLAADSGVSMAYISQIINGKRKDPSRKAVKKICDALGMAIEVVIAKGNIQSADQAIIPRLAVNCPPMADLQMIGKAGVVLTSGTIYGEALRQNIDAFFQAVQKEKGAGPTEDLDLKIESGSG